MDIRQGSNELDSSSPTARSSPVMLSAAKHLSAYRDRPFAALRVTRCDCSSCQVLFFKLNLALTKYPGHPVGADLSCPPPIYRPGEPNGMSVLICQYALSRPPALSHPPAPWGGGFFTDRFFEHGDIGDIGDIGDNGDKCRSTRRSCRPSCVAVSRGV